MNLKRTYSSNARFCHMVASDGSLHCWGCNYGHSLGLNVTNEGDLNSPVKFTLPPNPRGGITLIESMSTGEAHSLIISQDNPPLVYGWGSNTTGQVGLLGDQKEVLGPTLISLPVPHNVIQLCCGSYFSAALFEDGSLITWGANSEGQLGAGHRETVEGFVHVPCPEPFIQLAAGWEHIIGLAASGNVYGWGRNEDGKLGLGDTQNRCEPTLIPDLPKISKIYCGGHHSLALSREKKLYGWGWNYHGNLALGPGQDTLSPVLIMEGVEDVACGWSHLFAFLEEGGGKWKADSEDGKWVEAREVEGGARVVCWGFGEYGQLGQHDSEDKKTPRVFKLEERKPGEGEGRTEVGMEIEGIIANGYQTYVVTNDGTLWAFGHGANGRLGIGDEDGGNVVSPKRVAGKWEVPWGRQRKWNEVMKWLFLGRLEGGSEFSGLPTEVLFYVVGVLMR